MYHIRIQTFTPTLTPKKKTAMVELTIINALLETSLVYPSGDIGDYLKSLLCNFVVLPSNNADKQNLKFALCATLCCTK